jgi:insertion element IS1 protein InsB
VAVDRHAKQFLHCVLGARDTATGQQLWEAVKSNTLHAVMSDYWKPYEHMIPEALHTQSKAETYTVEGYNSLLRHFLARLRRKSKCYSKSHCMLLNSVMLFMLKWNGTLESILY